MCKLKTIFLKAKLVTKAVGKNSKVMCLSNSVKTEHDIDSRGFYANIPEEDEVEVVNENDVCIIEIGN